VHGIFTKAGDRPNIVPKEAAAHWYVRAANLRRLEALKDRVFACLQAGADAAGCRMEHAWQDPAYADMVDNPTMVGLYTANAAHTGRALLDPADVPGVVGSTDMGNVSHLVPSIHPMIQVSPPHVSIHSPDFTQYAASEDGDKAVLDGAKALGMTVVDLWLRPDALDAAKAEFAEAHAG
jgi:metal-dependent amidase/aminoacylase/carboxypeptidase family protein